MRTAIAIAIGFLVVPVTAVAAPPSLAVLDEHICLACGDVLPPSIRQSPGKKPTRDRGKDCDAMCVVDSEPVSVISVTCGRFDEEARKTALPGKTKPLPGLEDRAYAKQTNDALIVRFTDHDTPCSVILNADPQDPTSEAKAIALGRDVAKVLTPELIAKRRTVEAIVWAEDKTGQKAQAALAAWDKEAAALKELGTLSPGFPKVIDHKDKPGLPEGKSRCCSGTARRGRPTPS